jgi:hypothetical protein
LEHWEHLATTASPGFSRTAVRGKFIGNVVGSHHSLLAWFCNFSHTQQWQLLPMPGEETVGTGCVKISVSGIAAVFGATIANSDPANAVPALIVMDEFNILRAVFRKQPAASCMGNMCLWKKKCCRFF